MTEFDPSENYATHIKPQFQQLQYHYIPIYHLENSKVLAVSEF